MGKNKILVRKVTNFDVKVLLLFKLSFFIFMYLKESEKYGMFIQTNLLGAFIE